MKRLALFLDGTWNSVKSRTNVWVLSEAVAATDAHVRQCVYYDEGVGTKRFEWLRGGALGYGLSANVAQAYQHLVENYDDGDEIYIFGFSRGAYTARSIAGMIAKCGLLQRGADYDAASLFRRYQLSADTRPIYELEYVLSTGGALKYEERRLLASSRRVPIKLIGVWDTVGALGIPFGDIPGLSRRQFQFLHTRLSNLYEHAYHALALDEHREAYQPTLWTRFRPKVPDPDTGLPRHEPKVEQRWFMGAHADVGGGNPTSLPQLPLHWLAAKAEEAGLRFTGPLTPDGNAAAGPVTDSFAAFMFGLYKVLKGGTPFIRAVQAGTVEKETGWVDTVNETIDASVFERFRSDPNYRPAGLIAWADHLGIDPAAIHTAVDALGAKPL